MLAVSQEAIWGDLLGMCELWPAAWQIWNLYSAVNVGCWLTAS